MTDDIIDKFGDIYGDPDNPRFAYYCSVEKVVHWTRESAQAHADGLKEDGYSGAYVYECEMLRVVYDEDGHGQTAEPLPHFHVASSTVSRRDRKWVIDPAEDDA